MANNTTTGATSTTTFSSDLQRDIDSPSGYDVYSGADIQAVIHIPSDFAVTEVKAIFSRVWVWVIAGVGLGSLMHGFIPDNWILDHLGQGQWWSVPGAVLLGIPLYANASGVIPVVETLINQGLPVGTAMAFMMSVVAASFPEFMMLKQVMRPRLLLIFFMILLIFFTLSGWILNFVF